MLPHSNAWTDVRNDIYRQLAAQKVAAAGTARKEAGGQTVTKGMLTANFSSFHNLVIVVPEEPDCYEVVHVLNYFGFPFAVEEDNFFRSSRKEMGFAPDDSYPFLVINSSSEEMPEADLASKDGILSFLFN